MTSLRDRAGQVPAIRVLIAGSTLLILFTALALGPIRPATSGPDRLMVPVTEVPAQPVSADPMAVPEQLAVVGRVLDSQGQPIPGARLYPGNLPSREDGPPAFLTTTGADGRFHFTIARSDFAAARSVGTGATGPLVVAFADGYGPAWAEDLRIGDPNELVLTLPPDDVPLTGRLIDLEGRPVAGITVGVLELSTTPEGELSPWLEDVAARQPGYRAFSRLSRPMEADLARLLRPVTTGPDGRFRLTGLGRERLVSLLLQGPTTATQVLNAMTRPGTPVSVRFSYPTRKGPATHDHVIHAADFVGVVAPSRAVAGVVRDLDTGRPLAGVRIRNSVGFENPYPDSLYPRTDWPGTFQRTTTDEQGHYRLEGLPIRDQVTLRADPPEEQPYHSGTRTFANSPGGGVTPIDFALAPGVLVRGRVTDLATGAPVTALVEYHPTVDNEKAVQSREMAISEARRTDQEGRYAVVAFPGPGLIATKALGDRFLYADLVARGQAAHNPPFPNVNDSTSPAQCHAFATIDPGAITDIKTCDLRLTASPEPTITILDPDGRPLAGAQASGPSHTQLARQGWWQSREKARFTVTGLTDRRIRVVHFEHLRRRLTGSLVVRDSEPGPLVVRLSP